MPLYVLKIKCDLENIAELSFTESTLWQFNVESESGEVREGITFSASEETEMEGSRGTANFVMKWNKADKHQSSLKLTPLKKVDGKYKAQDSGSFVPILGMECRGLHPSAWIPGTDFMAVSAQGKTFPNVDLSDRDWADYDEENDEAVSVTNLEYVIERG